MKAFGPLGLGCWIYDTGLWNADRERQLFDTLSAALEAGVEHFDTATGYGSGASERLIGRFLADPAFPDRQARVFVASKAGISGNGQDPGSIVESVRRSLERLMLERIDLYYIHWPKSGIDLRPTMEGLDKARQEGLIGAVGVSNFTVEQLEQVSQVGKINVHQLPYNLIWRFREEDVIPYCAERGIAVVAYASIAHGILTGKFPRHPQFQPGDQRHSGVFLFEEPVWKHIWAAVEEMKGVAQAANRPLHQLAIRWAALQRGVSCALVGSNSAAQVRENTAALQGDLPASILNRLTEISDQLKAHIPREANPYRFNP